MTPPYCCAIQCLLRNLATHGAEQSEGKEGKARLSLAAFHCCCAVAFLEVSALRHLPHGANMPHNACSFVMKYEFCKKFTENIMGMC
jgi:hypothetical protein